jgi:hypothetical protein
MSKRSKRSVLIPSKAEPTCYSIVSKYNDPEKKVKDQVSCYPSSSSVNNQCEPPLTMTSVSLCFPVRNGKKNKHFLESLI